jgi:ATP-dependent helicase/DNAse subunit B
MNDKFSATWVSHSSITDFLNCPRAYFLKNVYRNPKTNHKIQLTNPHLSLGSAIHEVLESLSVLPTEERFKESLIAKLEKVWPKISGERGGFTDQDTELSYKNKAIEMLNTVMNNPGPLKNLAIKIKEDLPYFWLSEKDNIILCGKIDWLEYLKDSDSVHIIDFKSGKTRADSQSLQLPIYLLLVHHCQHRDVAKASYWYLLNNELVTHDLPDLEQANDRVLAIAKKIKLARKLNRFSCPSGESGCMHCLAMEKIIKGEAKLVGENDFGQDVFIVTEQKTNLEDQSQVL